MTSEQIAIVAGILLSLGFSYIPGLKSWFGALVPDKKRLIMLGLLLLVAAGAFALTCAGLGDKIGLSVTCDTNGLWGLLEAFVLAAIANQATYQISPGLGSQNVTPRKAKG